MKRLNLVLCALFFVVFTGCAGNKPTISEDWNWRPATLAVVFTNPVVVNAEDIEDDLPEYVNKFHEWMSLQLKKNIDSKAELINNNTPLRVNVMYYPLGISGNVNFYMSDSGIMFNGKDVFAAEEERLALPDADAYLFIDAININSVLTGGGMGLLGLLLHEGMMTMKASYAFYDGKTHQRIGVGTLDAIEEYAFGVARSNWESLMETAVKKLFDETPVLECDHCSVRSEANWGERKVSPQGTLRKEEPKKSVWD